MRCAREYFRVYFECRGLFSENYLNTRFQNTQEWNTDTNYDQFKKKLIALYEKEKDSLNQLTESQLEDQFLFPILKLLGWPYKVKDRRQICGKIDEPDATLYEDSLKQKQLAVFEAKKWSINLDGKNTSKNPEEEIIGYMFTRRAEWGILTNGHIWRLYYYDRNKSDPVFYELNLENLICCLRVDSDCKELLYFYRFFRKKAFIKTNGKTFLDTVLNEGKKLGEKLDKNFKKQALPVLEKIAQGFINNNKGLEDNLQECYDRSIWLAFKLIFILNCESKDILKIGKIQGYRKFSLREKAEKFFEDLKNNKIWSDTDFSTYKSILALFRKLKQGDKILEIKKFGKEFFDNENFYNENKISNRILNQCLIDLSYTDSIINDYSYLDVAHIGSVFEGVLGNKLKKEEGKISLVNDKGERKLSGSYYTPSFLVDSLVEDVLKSKVSGCKNSEDILNLKVCDPAMGSGAFLMGVIRYLSGKINKLIDENSANKHIPQGSSIRREILKNCIYGVDINANAVKLAKFSTWVYISKDDQELPNLDKNLIKGDSLDLKEFDWNENFPKLNPLEEDKGFDAVVGNPPWKKIKTETRKIINYCYPHKKNMRGQNNSQNLSKNEKLQANKMQELCNEKYKRYKSCWFQDRGQGDKDTYQFFSELFLKISKKDGNAGIILPQRSLIGTGSKPWRKKLIDNYTLKISLFLNNKQWIFPGVHAQKCLSSISILKNPQDKIQTLKVSAVMADEDSFRKKKYFTLNKNLIKKVKYIVPSFTHKKDIDTFKKMLDYPFFSNPNEWVSRFKEGDLHETNGFKKISSKYFLKKRLKYVDLKNSKFKQIKHFLIYKGDSIYLFESDSPKLHSQGSKREYLGYINKKEIREHLFEARKKSHWKDMFSNEYIEDKKNLHCLFPRVAYGVITGNTNTRTLCSALVPPNIVLGNSCPYLILAPKDKNTKLNNKEKIEAFYLGIFNSMVFDWYVRRVIDDKLNLFFFEIFPIPYQDLSDPLVKELIKTAGKLSAQDKRLKTWASKVGINYEVLSETKKYKLECRLDAVVALLYKLNESDLNHIYKTFSRSKNYDNIRNDVLTHFNELKALEYKKSAVKKRKKIVNS